MTEWPPAKIKALRKKYGENQQEFSDRCRVHMSTIQTWEQGKGEPNGPATYMLDDLAEKIGFVWEPIANGRKLAHAGKK